MKRKIAVIIFLLCCTSFLPLNAQWAKTYGESWDDIAFSIQQTSDGGYIVAGRTESFGNAYYGNAWILKLNSEGEIEWEKTYGMPNEEDQSYSIQQTTDGGYIVGSFYQYTYDVWILKLSSDGNIEWERTYNSSGAQMNLIQQTTDGGYILVWEGDYYSMGFDYDISVLKLASDGAIEWQKTYGDYAVELAHSIQQTTDGGYVLAGGMESFGAGSLDIWVLKLASDGSVEWQKTYGGCYFDRAYSIQQTSGGGYVVIGETHSFGAGSTDIWILKLASDGSIEWQKTYGGSQWDEASSIQQTSDGGYVVAGKTSSFGSGSSDIWVLKLASDGAVEWQKRYGGSRDEEASSIQQTGDGGYVVAGYTNTYGAGKADILILKLSSNGDIEPSCYLVNESNADVSDSSVSPVDTDIIPEILDITSNTSNITPQDSEALVYSLCSGQRTLNLSATSGGTTEPPPGTYMYDQATRITIRAYPEDGFNLTGWSGEELGRYNPLSITMDSDKSIQAVFSPYPAEWEEAKKTPCFIATAAYESSSHPYVRILRDFRDKYLMTNELGQKFVEVYYRYSPFMADLIETNRALKVAVRMNLLPLVAVCFSALHFGPVITGGIFLVILMLPIFFIPALRNKRTR